MQRWNRHEVQLQWFCCSIMIIETKGWLLGRTKKMSGLLRRRESEEDELSKVQPNLFLLFIKRRGVYFINKF